jgi:uncharacterized protein YyaL (SSP411 family)
MKKQIITLAAIAGITLSACNGNGNTNNTTATDSTQTEVTENSTDASAIISNLTEAVKNQDPKTIASALETADQVAKQFIEEGKVEEAKSYLSSIQQYIKDNKATIESITSKNATASSLLQTITSIDPVGNLQNAATATKEDAAAAVESVKTGVESKVAAEKEKAAEKVNNAVSEQQKKASDAENNAARKTNDAVNKAAGKASDAVNNAAGKALKGIGL